jgi:hypothetical protein
MHSIQLVFNALYFFNIIFLVQLKRKDVEQMGILHRHYFTKIYYCMNKHILLFFLSLTMICNVKAQYTITGSGTTGYVPKFSGLAVIDNSKIFQTGNFVGVNTTNPSATFHINSACGASNIGTLVLTSDNSTYGGTCLYPQTRGDLFVARNINGGGSGTVRTDFVIRAGTGKTGIGIASPYTQLDVKPTGSSIDPFVAYDNSENVLFYVHRNGNVGLGTGSPSARFHLRNTNSSVNPLAIFNPSVSQITTINNDGAIGINTTTPGALVDAKNAPNYSWLFHGQTASGVTRFLVTDDGRMSIGTTPVFTQSTFTLKSAFGSGSSTSIEMVAPGGSNTWQSQFRFIASNSAVRHAIVDDQTTTTNDLLLSPGLGGGAASVVRTNGKFEAGAGVVNPNRSTYNGSLFVRGDGVGIDIFNQQATTGLNSQIRFSGTSGTRHLIADDYGTGNLLIKPGNGGVANSIVEVQGRMKIGNVTTPSPNAYSLYVEKGILAESFKCAIKSTGDWSDYVFDECYELKTLDEVEDYVIKNKHLPDVPSAEEMVKNGLDVAKMNALLLRKIEELTLYILELRKTNKHDN